MTNQKYVYHSSKTQGLKVLEPKVSTHKVPWVYATKDIVAAALFLGHNFDFICQVGALGEQPIIWERFEGAFDLAYKDKKGSIYYLKPDTFKEGMTTFSLEVVSEVPVKVEKEIIIDNAKEYLLNLEKEGKLEIYMFPNIPKGRPSDKEDIVVKAIKSTFDLGEIVLEQVEEYHPDVLDRVIKGLKEQGYNFKSEKWLSQ